MKKKKKLDPGLALQKEVKKQKKIEKQIRKLELKGRILKPIEEIEGDRQILKTLDKRQRPSIVIAEEELERRSELNKRWSKYKYHQFIQEGRIINRVITSQRKALDELRKESEELYQMALQIDEKLIPFERQGPTDTPPIKDYTPPDGDYIDTTRKFDK
ncbi:hypothetical protein HELRODRAFT_155730 [Helobdella robusta]|uniref:Large ribosomal subunit protein mL40 n=1 Tax=Helobdella robusta TaxID=6412 RepID=T1ELL6_HELRO|nr:hypothetical protein HELRODRAFT_155730 [Helobdella robusta]ESO06603.1 hypothetical protein HELRODRAFT_155730 [Helobdella robusta]